MGLQLIKKSIYLILIIVFAAGPVATISAAELKTENVVLITIDGLRWQDVFSGAEALLISPAGGVGDTNRLRSKFWRDTSEERRKVLLPFFWNTIAQQGQLYGNQNLGSTAKVTNGRNFTYPGFNEILAGFADDRINKNAKIPNPNVTVLEWLNQKPSFKGRIVAFANWDVFPYILNAERAGIPIWTSYPEGTLKNSNLEMRLVGELADGITPLWPDMNFDIFFHRAALAHVHDNKPRVVWIAFSETDQWAHEGRYDLYLSAANRIDGYVKELWEVMQQMDAYRSKTTFILTTDHGRGTGLTEWKNHGAQVVGAEGIWIAVIGPDTKALGERQNISDVGQNQIAATIAELLGQPYKGSVEKAGNPIADILPSLKKTSGSE